MKGFIRLCQHKQELNIKDQTRNILNNKLKRNQHEENIEGVLDNYVDRHHFYTIKVKECLR